METNWQLVLTPRETGFDIEVAAGDRQSEEIASCLADRLDSWLTDLLRMSGK